MVERMWIDRPDVPRAAGFEVLLCGDPVCGPHFIALDKNGEPICEIVLSKAYTAKLIETLQGLLREPH
jgi:hypothetical protein